MLQWTINIYIAVGPTPVDADRAAHAGGGQ